MSASATELSAVLDDIIAETRRAGGQRVLRDQPIRCRLGTYVLRSDSSFDMVYPDSRSVWGCTVLRLDAPAELGSLVVKTVFRRDTNEAVRGPPREVKFYAEVAQRVSMPELRIPKHYATNVQADGKVQLFIEHLDDLRPISSREELHRAAWVLGRLAGHCNAAQLYRCEWLPQGRLMPQFHQMLAFEQLLARLPVGDRERAGMLESFQRLFDRLVEANELYAQGLPTLCHGDLNPRNLVAQRQGFAVIDWETVKSGRVGEDLSKFALRLLRDGETQTEEEDEKLIAAYVAGAAPYFSSDPSSSIRRVYQLRLVVDCLGRMNVHWQWIRKARDAATRRKRLHVLAQIYRRMAERAREALTGGDG